MKEKNILHYHKIVNENIKNFGFHITYVLESTSPSFCYTTGVFETYGIPEIFISALPKNLSYELVTSHVNRFKDTKNITLKQMLESLTDRFPVYLIEAPISNLLDNVLLSTKYYESNNFRYVQLIYPDVDGYFPKDEGYDYDQEIKGELWR
jgi:Domain of unknown function (DUF4262)